MQTLLYLDFVINGADFNIAHVFICIYVFAEIGKSNDDALLTMYVVSNDSIVLPQFLQFV